MCAPVGAVPVKLSRSEGCQAACVWAAAPRTVARAQSSQCSALRVITAVCTGTGGQLHRRPLPLMLSDGGSTSTMPHVQPPSMINTDKQANISQGSSFRFVEAFSAPDQRSRMRPVQPLS